MTFPAAKVLATLLLAAASLPLAAAPAAADPACTQRVLNIVAHHDDDMFFLSPDLYANLADPALCVRTVFLVASDYHGDNPATPDVDERMRYVEAREQGIRHAYAAAAGLDVDDWQKSAYSAAGIAATAHTLGDRVSVIEMRIPDNASGGELWSLYAEGGRLVTVQGELNPPQTLRRDSLHGFLRGVAADFQPDVINTVDPTGDQHRWVDLTALQANTAMRAHPDHVAVARLVMWTFPDVPVHYYRDYSTMYLPENITGAAYQARLAIYWEYDAWDDDIHVCTPNPAPNAPACEGWWYAWLHRQYRAEGAWMGDLVVPLPPSARPGPQIDRVYRLENVQTGLRLGVSSGGPLQSANPGDGLQQQFRLLVTDGAWRAQNNQVGTDGGWLLQNVQSGLCVAVEGGSVTSQAAVVQTPCRTGRQVVRIHGNETSGYQLRFATTSGQDVAGVPDLALTATGGDATGIVQRPATGGQEQWWRIVPVS
ncbi:PIG-L family deacetylase [Catenuloplanes japonicus]|uniref:PIG-L family deacetylase n=1 Tax=Catenuloplanes japonicus TaxID=33876 RepID=UPI0005253C3C|nr:PIG-L family deacetylase [Catenuloplanes japonicus]